MAKVYAGYTLDAASGLPANSEVVALRATVAYTDTVAKALFTIPAGAYIVEWVINVTTAFNSDGTDQVNLGITGTAAKFASALDVSTTGLKTGVVLTQIGALQASAQPVLGIYAPGGSAASTGAMTIICRVFIP